MDIFFTDPDQVPLPPDEVRILDLQVEPYPDGRRVRVFVELTPFQKKPNGDLSITDASGHLAATTSFVEAITPKNEMVLHLRALDPAGQYNLKLTIFYSSELDPDGQEADPIFPPEQTVVDEKVIQFAIGN
jgi:hypothetical protein